MRVEIWTDFVSPVCYIAKRKFDIALNQFSKQQYVKVEYKSFLLHTNDRIATGKWKDLLMTTCGIPANEIEQWIEGVRSQANELNLPLQLANFTHTNTLDAHRLVKFAATEGKEREVIDSLFEHFFSLKDKSYNNINEKHILIQIGKRCGLCDEKIGNLLAIEKYSRAIEVDEADALEIGIENVPFFIFNEKYALVGNQTVEMFLEVLETSWQEDEERLLKKQQSEVESTSYCVGDDCNM